MKVSRFSCLLFLAAFASAWSQTPSPATAPAGTVVAPVHHRISLDVLVADKDGKAATDIEPTDFTILDNDLPRKLQSFRRTDGATGNKFDPPVQVIIVLDAVNLPYQVVTLLRLEVEKYLRLNNGQLPQPTSVFIFSSQGLHVQPQPSRDGNALATMLDQATGTVRARGGAGDVYGQREQFQSSVETISDIASNEATKPGRKLLIWLGPGWPLLADRHFIQTNESRDAFFHDVVNMSRRLRDARIAIYALYPSVGLANVVLWEQFSKPVRDPRKTEAGNLALQVLANQTGGRVLPPNTDVVGSIAQCVADAAEYYTLTFEPPPAAHADEFHDLKVVVNKPGLATRTTTGYYNQP